MKKFVLLIYAFLAIMSRNLYDHILNTSFYLYDTKTHYAMLTSSMKAHFDFKLAYSWMVLSNI